MISYSNLIQIAAAPKLNSGLFLILKKKKNGDFFFKAIQPMSLQLSNPFSLRFKTNTNKAKYLGN